MKWLETTSIAEFLVTYAALVAIIWVRYFFVAGLFYWLLWGRPEEKVRATRLSAVRPNRRIVLFEIKMSLLSALIYAVPGALVVIAYQAGATAIYAELNTVTQWVWIPASIFTYLAIHDAYFYWSHRVMHHPALFRAMHLAHHRSRHPTPWAGFSFHPWESIISAWLLPLATFFIPIHIGVVFFLLIFMTVLSITNHAGWEMLPRSIVNGFWGQHFISAAHHNVHHTDYHANYGLYFRFWDKVMKTDEGLSDLPDASTLRN